MVVFARPCRRGYAKATIPHAQLKGHGEAFVQQQFPFGQRRWGIGTCTISLYGIEQTVSGNSTIFSFRTWKWVAMKSGHTLGLYTKQSILPS